MRQSFRIASRAVAMLGKDGMKKGIKLSPNFVFPTRQFSEFYNSYPATKTIKSGEYLFQAVRSGDEKSLIDALDSGIDPNFRDAENETPLMIAAENNQIHLIPHLLIHGANLNLQDNLGETALMKAAREVHQDVVKFLVDNGAQVDILNYENMTARDATLDVGIDEILCNAKGDNMKEASLEEHNIPHGEAKKKA